MTTKTTKILFIAAILIFVSIFGYIIIGGFMITKPTEKAINNTSSVAPPKTSSESAGASVPSPTTSTKTTLTASLVARHSNPSDCWIILSGSVYNISTYSHSGGASHIVCGKDQTSALTQKHGSIYSTYFNSFLVGKLGAQI